MDFADLRLFVDCVRLGSYAAAARVAGVDPSSVSRAIARLEKSIGTRLLHRTTRRLSLTEAGQRYFDRVSPLLEELSAAKDEAAAAAFEPGGTVRLAAPVSFAMLNVVPLLPTLAEEYPRLDFDLRLTDAAPDLVAERIDLAVRIGPLGDSGYVSRRLAKMDARVCASPAYLDRHAAPRTPDELADHVGLHLSMPGFGDTWRLRDESGEVTKVTVPGRVRTTNALALKDLALAGLGVVLQGRWIVGRELRDGTLIDLFSNHTCTAAAAVGFGEADVWLLRPTRSYVPAKVQVVWDFLLDSFASGPPWDADEAEEKPAQ